MIEKVSSAATSQLDTLQRELFDFLRQRSVSADPAFRNETLQSADWTAAYLKKIGVEHVRLLETARYPIVYGDWLHAPGKPTILIYGHYDVQPPDPLDKWTTPAFEPTVRDGKIYARGVADNKGQLLAMMAAVGAWLQTTKALPVNVKFFIEGDEESGSAGIEAVPKYAQEVACDAVLISDACWLDREHPAIFYAFRGLAYVDVSVRGADRDVHSGVFGNLVPNPINALVKTLAPLCAFDGPIQLPGFLDDILPLTAEERQAFAQVHLDTDALARTYQLTHVGVGEPEFTVRERNWARPTMDLCGVWGGYMGAGSKTIIPSEAHAKVSFRLVPNQSSTKTIELFKSYLTKTLPKGITLTRFEIDNQADPVYSPPTDPFIQAGVKALAAATGKPALVAREPASIPIAINFRRIAKAPVLLFGMGFTDGNIHSPNEHLELTQWRQGIVSDVHLLHAMSTVGR